MVMSNCCCGFDAVVALYQSHNTPRTFDPTLSWPNRDLCCRPTLLPSLDVMLLLRLVTCLANTGALNCFQYFPSAVSLIDLAGNCFT